MLKNSFSARLLKKVQMPGGAPIVPMGRWVPGASTHRRWAFFSSLLGG
jgi:hypothetical protein